MKSTSRATPPPCPCGSGIALEACCGPLLDGTAHAATAQQLMRSRFSAYCLKNRSYLLASWHPDTRPTQLLDEELHGIKWLSLTISDCQQGSQDDQQGTVTFCARFKIGGKAGRLQESSRFVRQQERWYYLDGTVSEQP